MVIYPESYLAARLAKHKIQCCTQDAGLQCTKWNAVYRSIRHFHTDTCPCMTPSFVCHLTNRRINEYVMSYITLFRRNFLQVEKAASSESSKYFVKTVYTICNTVSQSRPRKTLSSLQQNIHRDNMN